MSIFYKWNLPSHTAHLHTTEDIDWKAAHFNPELLNMIKVLGFFKSCSLT